MKSSIAILLGTAAAVVLSSTAIHAQEREPANPKAKSGTYKTPLRGATVTPVRGGTRGIGNTLTVNVLAPSATGFTTQEKPTICWFASRAIDKPVELAITSTASLQEAATPVLEI